MEARAQARYVRVTPMKARRVIDHDVVCFGLKHRAHYKWIITSTAANGAKATISGTVTTR